MTEVEAIKLVHAWAVEQFESLEAPIAENVPYALGPDLAYLYAAIAQGGKFDVYGEWGALGYFLTHFSHEIPKDVLGILQTYITVHER